MKTKAVRSRNVAIMAVLGAAFLLGSPNVNAAEKNDRYVPVRGGGFMSGLMRDAESAMKEASRARYGKDFPKKNDGQTEKAPADTASSTIASSTTATATSTAGTVVKTGGTAAGSIQKVIQSVGFRSPNSLVGTVKGDVTENPYPDRGMSTETTAVVAGGALLSAIAGILFVNGKIFDGGIGTGTAGWIGDFSKYSLKAGKIKLGH